MQVVFARGDHRVVHVQLFREALHGLPARVAVLDVGLLVQLEEVEVLVGQLEEPPPAMALQPEPPRLLKEPRAVARHVDALGAGVGDDAFEPVPARHQPLPRRPAELRRGQRLRRFDLAALHADAHAEVLEDRPVRAPAAVLVVGDHLLAAGLDDAQARVPVAAVGGDLELEHRVALARVEAVLQREHARAAARQRLVEPAAARHEGVDDAVHAAQHAHANTSVTRLLRRPSDRILATARRPISAVSLTCVPPHACRSTPGISSSRTRPSPRGGATDMVFTSSGRASSSASVIQRELVACAAPTSALTPASSCSFTSLSISTSKSRCDLSAPMRPPVTGARTTAPSRCSAVCMRMWRWRLSQSISMLTGSPTRGMPSLGSSTCTIESGDAPLRVSTTR